MHPRGVTAPTLLRHLHTMSLAGTVAQNMLHKVLSGADANRVMCTLRKLGRHCARHWVLTTGLAVEVHRLQRGRKASVRKLGDIDSIAETFDRVPESLADDFMFLHIHPFDPPGKTLLQAVDAESAVRINVFRAYGAILNRSSDLRVKAQRRFSG